MAAKTVDEYIVAQPEAYQEKLEEMRSLIKSDVPEAEELISYQVPAFKYHYLLVGFGVSKQGCSFYTMNPQLVAGMKEELKGQKYSGATLHFPLDQPLPEVLIRKILRKRVQENVERAASKN